MGKITLLSLSVLVLIALNACKSTSGSLNGLKDIDPYKIDIQKTASGTRGAVVSAHPLASKAGLQVLKQGGNAFDAAIATQLALAVVYPNAGNLGGGGFLVAYTKNQQAISIDYREKAPGAAHRDMYLDDNGTPQTNLSQYGQLASGVPGTVAGIFATLPYANLSMDKLIEPAIQLAAYGFVLTEREANNLNALQPDLKKYNSILPVFVRQKPWQAGDTLIQKDLAETLSRIKKYGKSGFYEGVTADLIVAEMQRGNGIISKQDLKDYTAVQREPHRFIYRGHEVISMPMPSSGGVLLHQMLKMVEDHPLKSYGFHTPGSVQLMTEVERRAYADRAKFMGDADFYQVPVAEITSPAYLQKRMSDFIPGKAGNSVDIAPGMIGLESEETTHLSIIDKEGTAVSVTTTLNNSYGSRVVVGGAGFFLNDEMDDFSIKPGVPNMYGAVGGEANAIAPGKRMLSSMTPTIVLKNNYPFLVVGTPGGTTIPTSVFQSIVNIVDFDLDPERAVNAPKFHHQWLPDSLQVEKGFSPALITALRNMGYQVHERGPIGRTELIKIMPDKSFVAVADSRGDDTAVAY